MKCECMFVLKYNHVLINCLLFLSSGLCLSLACLFLDHADLARSNITLLRNSKESGDGVLKYFDSCCNAFTEKK